MGDGKEPKGQNGQLYDDSEKQSSGKQVFAVSANAAHGGEITTIDGAYSSFHSGR